MIERSIHQNDDIGDFINKPGTKLRANLKGSTKKKSIKITDDSIDQSDENKINATQPNNKILVSIISLDKAMQEQP